MLCQTMLRYAMPCYAMLWHAASQQAIQLSVFLLCLMELCSRHMLQAVQRFCKYYALCYIKQYSTASPHTCYYQWKKDCQGRGGRGWGHRWCCGGVGWGQAALSCLQPLGALPFLACPHLHCLSSCSSSARPPRFSTCTLPPCVSVCR